MPIVMLSGSFFQTGFKAGWNLPWVRYVPVGTVLAAGCSFSSLAGGLWLLRPTQFLSFSLCSFSAPTSPWLRYTVCLDVPSIRVVIGRDTYRGECLKNFRDVSIWMVLIAGNHKSVQRQNFSSFDYIPLRLSYTVLKQPISTTNHSFGRKQVNKIMPKIVWL